jgi:hypothetical protein
VVKRRVSGASAQRKSRTRQVSSNTATRDSKSSPKRGAAERLGLHAWHPYYAGFSEAFVAEVLSELSVPSGSVILDPMAGSGTTMVVAQQNDYLGLGVELNPALATITRAKDATLAAIDDLEDAVAEVVSKAQSHKSDAALHTAVHGWIPSRKYADLKRLHFAIAQHTSTPVAPLAPKLAKVVGAGNHNDTGSTKNLLEAALLMTARNASAALKTKNPTWLKPGGNTHDDGEDIFQRFASIAAGLLTDLRRTFPPPSTYRRVVVQNGDAKTLAFADESIDAIVTSPPYLTRIDYAIGTAPELIVLGFDTDDALRTIRRSIMGSTCVTGGSYDVANTWGPICLATIDRVRRHHSKSSANYYAKTHIQYFRDAEALLRECLRVLRPGAPAVFVVQDSWYKDVPIPLGTIYCEMAHCLGAATGQVLRSETVRSHLGLVNTRARRYTKGQIQEHIVVLRK